MPGFGGGASEANFSGGGGGFGGALFVRTGTVAIRRTIFQNNMAAGGSGGNIGAGKGGAIFALDALTSPNGNDSGYPAALPVVAGCDITFATNSASTQLGTDTDNHDTYGVSRAALIAPCDDLFADGFE